MATRFEIISQTVVRSIALENHFDALREGFHKPIVACLPLVTAHNYVCSLIRTCCSTTRCGLLRERGTTTSVQIRMTSCVLLVALFASTASFLCVAGSIDMITFCHDSTVASAALEVGDHTTGNTNNVIRVRTEVVVPRSRSSPHLVVLQQVRINEHAQLCAVTKGRHAKFGLGNSTLYFRLIGRLFFQLAIN